ncbi:pickpocket protein 11 isoform X3 [Bactrocera oleae]|uniref:pickpocket protein 11 isoform X3 n=1 Tax=Bactrocera oleae TaxID=104688 RepID=UPI00387E4661
MFWCFILCSMLTLSIYTLWNSLSLNADNPTILYINTKTGIFWGKTFPTITFCNFNHISKKKLNELLIKDFSSDIADQIRPLIPYVLYSSLPVNATPAAYRSLHMLLTSANYTHSDFLQKISPDCESQLVRCKIRDQIYNCNVLFQRVQTQHGFCCAFNYDAVINRNQTTEELSIHSNRFGYRWGLTVLLDPQVEDYYASRNKFAGYQIYTSTGNDFISINMPNQMVFPGDEIHIHAAQHITEATTLLKNQDLHWRRCYLPNERKLLAFPEYTQQNCFAECRSKKVWRICGCVPPLWPRAQNWTVCSLMQASCVMAQIDTLLRTIYPSDKDYKTDLKAERYICDCYPECEYCIHRADFDGMTLDRNYSINNMDLYRGIELKNHLVVHTFYADMSGNYMRLDVQYHWQNYFGLFGGITSLYMGISFISCFEIVFFLLVRPMGHLLTRITKRRQAMKKQVKLKKMHTVMRK